MQKNIKLFHKNLTDKEMKRLFLLLAFLVPAFSILISFIKLGIRPFGGNSLLGMDLWSQYFPMLRHQVESRRDLAASLFSWDGALGTDIFVQNAYYCNSPFNWLLLLSPLKYLVDALDYLILFKFGLAGLSFALYCKYHFKIQNWATVACSTAYALCSYSLAFISQVMWFDAVLFFPLILLGFEMLMKEKKSALYCIMLALTMYSSFYISFSICLFLILYFFVYSLENIRELKFRGIFFGGVRFSVYSLLAAGMAAFVLLPVYFGLSRTIASDIPAPTTPELYHSVLDVLRKMLVDTPASLQFDVPNIYSTVFVFLVLPLFLLNKKIHWMRKLVYMLLTVFLYFSMNLNFLDYVWHGFHFPNQLPGRWTFIFSFVLILMIVEVLLKFDGIQMPALCVSILLAIALYVLLIFTDADDELSTVGKIMSIIFIALYAISLIMLVRFRDDHYAKTVSLLLSVCLIVECFTNATLVLYGSTEVGTVSTYTMYDDDMKHFKEEYLEKDESFQRAEVYYNWTFDHCQLFGIKGLTYYSSTMDGDAYEFFRQLGYRVYAKNVSTVYNPYSPVLNSIFSVKYIADLAMQMDPNYLVKKGEYENLDILVNEKVLPPVFAASERVLTWEPRNGDSPYDAQNRFFSAIVGKEINVYQKLPSPEIKTENATISSVPGAWDTETYRRINKDEPVKVQYRFTVDRDGPVYLCQNYKQGDMTISANGKDVITVLYREPMKYLGNLKKGDTVEISVETSGVNIGTCALALYSFDKKGFEAEFNKLFDTRTRAVESKNGLTCTVVNEKEQLMFTSVPAASMTCLVDDEEVEINQIGQYLAAIRVPEGEHTIRFVYRPKGLNLGIGISCACLLIFAGLQVGKEVSSRKKKKESESE